MVTFPAANDLLELADGTMIDPLTGKVVKSDPNMVEVPTHSEAQRIVTQVRRNVNDLPELPEKMNTISVIVAYTLFGLTETDIAITTNLPVEQVRNIKSLEAFDDMYDGIVRDIIEADSDDVRNRFKQHSRQAQDKVLDLLDSENEAIVMRATDSILDRAGHRPADIVEHRHKVEGGLHIEITKRDPSQVTPMIDITPIEVEV